MKRELSQQEIDAVFQRSTLHAEDEAQTPDAPTFDFKRPNRIAKSQVRALHVLHESFVRSLVPDLSSYLHTYIVMNLVSVEQISYSEFLDGLPPSTFIVCLGLKPYDGNAVLEINPSLVFPMLEMLLGGSGLSGVSLQREITDIEQSLMESIVRMMLRNLSEAWRSVATIDFSLQSLEADRQFLQVIAPTEAVVAIGIEMRMGDSSGLINLAMPSLIVKMMRHKFDQQWSLRKAATTIEDEKRMLRILQPSFLRLDARLRGPRLSVSDLLAIQKGDVLAFSYDVDRPIEATLNGSTQFLGNIVRSGRRSAFRVSQVATEHS